MKLISFTKMVGAGNDFLVVEARKKTDYARLALKACCRTEGVGADGLLILDHSHTADCKMRIMNPDGSEAEMCGNGARCMAAYVFKKKSFRKKTLRVETLAGIIHARNANHRIAVRLNDPVNYTDRIMLCIHRRPIHVSFINTGVPHVVCFVESLMHIDVNTIGRKIRFDKKFSPQGTNVNFVEQIKKNFIHVRTYERGIEAETQACGTGSAACALVAFLKATPQVHSKKNAIINVKTQSGEILTIRFNCFGQSITDVWLSGSARFVAEGKFYF